MEPEGGEFWRSQSEPVQEAEPRPTAAVEEAGGGSGETGPQLRRR